MNLDFPHDHPFFRYFVSKIYKNLCIIGFTTLLPMKEWFDYFGDPNHPPYNMQYPNDI